MPPLSDSTWTNPTDIQRRFRNPRSALGAIEDANAGQTVNETSQTTLPHQELPDIPDPRGPNPLQLPDHPLIQE